MFLPEVMHGEEVLSGVAEPQAALADLPLSPTTETETPHPACVAEPRASNMRRSRLEEEQHVQRQSEGEANSTLLQDEVERRVSEGLAAEQALAEELLVVPASTGKQLELVVNERWKELVQAERVRRMEEERVGHMREQANKRLEHVKDAVDQVLEHALAEYAMGNYRTVVELLVHKYWDPQQEFTAVQDMYVAILLSGSYRGLLDFAAALPHAQRYVRLAARKARSLDHALALKGLCMVQLGLRIPTARSTLAEALAIMEERGLQLDEQYGGMVLVLGEIEYEAGRLSTALEAYERARGVLVQFRDGREYGPLLNSMALCHEMMGHWAEAMACYREAVEYCREVRGPGHSRCATTQYNLAELLFKLKQHAEAIPLLKEALAIDRRVFGHLHPSTRETAAKLLEARLLAGDDDVVTNEFLMCHSCGGIKEKMLHCQCRRVWYCDTSCQLKHADAHSAICESQADGAQLKHAAESHTFTDKSIGLSSDLAPLASDAQLPM